MLFAILAVESAHEQSLLKLDRFGMAKTNQFMLCQTIFAWHPRSFVANLLFYGMNSLAFVSFLILSMHWPELMCTWQTIESLAIFRNCAYKPTYIRRVRLIALTTMLLALSIFNPSTKSLASTSLNAYFLFTAEHLLCVAAACHYIFVYNDEASTVIGFVKVLIPSLVPQSHSLPFGIGILMCFMNESATFVWNFLDIFLMIIAVGLSTHFKVLNIKLEQAAIEVNETPIHRIALKFILILFAESFARILDGHTNSIHGIMRSGCHSR